MTGGCIAIVFSLLVGIGIIIVATYLFTKAVKSGIVVAQSLEPNICH